MFGDLADRPRDEIARQAWIAMTGVKLVVPGVVPGDGGTSATAGYAAQQPNRVNTIRNARRIGTVF
jgi:hypothetical protein